MSHCPKAWQIQSTLHPVKHLASNEIKTIHLRNSSSIVLMNIFPMSTQLVSFKSYFMILSKQYYYNHICPINNSKNEMPPPAYCARCHTITQEGNIPVQSISENLRGRQMFHLCQGGQSQQVSTTYLISLTAVTGEQ